MAFLVIFFDLIAKSRSGLGLHVNSKHKEEIVEAESNVDQTAEETPEISKLSEPHNFKCEKCEFESNNKLNIEKHVAEEHTTVEIHVENEIKLEVFLLVEYEVDVFEARKVLIDKLSAQKEV